MDGGSDFYGVTKDAAQVVGGAATATGGYLYFTKTLGWVRLTVGAGTTFMGGMMFFEAGSSVVSFFTDKHMPSVASGVAGTLTLGIIYALRKAAEHLDLLELFGRKSA